MQNKVKRTTSAAHSEHKCVCVRVYMSFSTCSRETHSLNFIVLIGIVNAIMATIEGEKYATNHKALSMYARVCVCVGHTLPHKFDKDISKEKRMYILHEWQKRESGSAKKNQRNDKNGNRSNSLFLLLLCHEPVKTMPYHHKLIDSIRWLIEWLSEWLLLSFHLFDYDGNLCVRIGQRFDNQFKFMSSNCQIKTKGGIRNWLNSGRIRTHTCCCCRFLDLLCELGNLILHKTFLNVNWRRS